MSYKVVIPCAGLGSRLGNVTKYVPKALVSIGVKPAISRIIEMFPKDCEFVIPVGYKGELIKEYIHLAYPDLKVKFVDILLYSGSGSGLGYTLNQCKEYLQEPFIFCSCDTIVTTDIIPPTCNWMAWDDRDMISQYRTISIENDVVLSINEKIPTVDENDKPYIGLAGIFDYETFWQCMEDQSATEQGESYAFRKMIENRYIVRAIKYTWFDLGIQIELDNTRNMFEKDSNVNILPKEDEAIWLLKDKAIKFHNDPDFISKRVERANLLHEFIPQILDHTQHMYSSEIINGPVLSKCITIPIFEQFLEFSKSFWNSGNAEAITEDEMFLACRRFYVDKTIDRVHQFYKKYNHEDGELYINGEKYPSFQTIMNKLDLSRLCSGVPTTYHGDYHFENIMYDPQSDEFKMLDWRQGFDILLNTGDCYYDMAKLLHGLIISHEIINFDLYEVKWEDENVTLDFNRKQKLVACEKIFYKWLEDNGYDVVKVKVLTAIIFLNIAALHHYNYCELLYTLGIKMLWDNAQEGFLR